MGGKVVISTCFGGFDLSVLACRRLLLLGSPHVESYLDEAVEGDGRKSYYWNGPRHDALLVQVVEELGSAAAGDFADLAVVELDVPCYQIDEYDGRESVMTPDSQTWIFFGDQG